jgi:RNA polymerase sigma-70 factor (ECF subfamily)
MGRRGCHTLVSAPDGAPESRRLVDQRGLVERAAKGDHDAFAALASAVFPRVSGVAQLILRDPELARDAAQETLIRAWRDLPGLREPDRFDAWLHRLVVRTSLNLVRRRRHRPTEVQIKPLDVPWVADESNRVADREIIDEGLRRLPPEWRAIVVLHFYVGLSLPETAQALGLPLGTVKSRLHRSLAAMRAAIGLEDQSISAPVRGGQTA